MADLVDTKVVKQENPELFPHRRGWEDHLHQYNVKKGYERLDRRSAAPNNKVPKKHGHGGKFTVDGPYTEEDYVDPIPAAMDENDPNYTDPAEEEADKEAGVPVIEVPKVELTGAATDFPAS